MGILSRFASTKRNTIQKNIGRGTLSLTVAAGLSLVTAAAFADDPTSMAPPIETSAPQTIDSSGPNGVNTSADSVFNWQEIPVNQQVPLVRAAFDKGGYQLYDTAGETIIVPFTNQNLYVMKFAQSTNGKLYFMNEGGYPVLYVPENGYLENATVSGAHWYPFGQDFHPSEPVFLGVAPSYTEFIDMGWYPDEVCYGGYYGHTSFLAGGLFLPTVGLFFEFGGHPYYGWDGYRHYYRDHPDFYHTDYYRRDFYHDAGHPYGGYSHPFNGAGRPFYAHRNFGGPGGAGGHFGSVRTFRGASGAGNGSRGYTVNHNSFTINHNNYSGGQRFGGSQSDSSRTFRGASNFGQGASSFRSSSHNYSGAASYGGQSTRTVSGFGQSSRNFSSGHSFSGGGGRSAGSSRNSGGDRNSGGRKSPIIFGLIQRQKGRPSGRPFFVLNTAKPVSLKHQHRLGLFIKYSFKVGIL